ncbi:MAG: glutamate--tRNA ligase family protein [Chloroflexota bacterium]
MPEHQAELLATMEPTAADLHSRLPAGATTRFAPAPTGYLHLGHLANAIHVWGLTRVTGGRIVLRIEDHDRIRCRPEYDAALLDDLEWLGLRADVGPVRQSESDEPYERALARLRSAGRIYACDCTRSTFAEWSRSTGRSWTGPGCPGRCRERGLDERSAPVLRVVVDDSSEAWDDLRVGWRGGAVNPAGDLPVRDRHGNWTYGFAVVVDDLRQGIDLVIRGADLLDSTPAQIRLGRLLGRPAPPAFYHHDLIRRPDGRKLSKADGDTAIGDLRRGGVSAASLLGLAAVAIGLQGEPRPLEPDAIAGLFG